MAGVDHGLHAGDGAAVDEQVADASDLLGAQVGGADPSRHVHVAQSLFHDIAPANELDLRNIWINRLGEQAPEDARPTRELPGLTGLGATLDELVAP